MALITSEDAERDALVAVANLMIAAARTAPKASGVDGIAAAILTGAEKDQLAAKMREKASLKKAKSNRVAMIRDADRVDAAPVVVLIGSRGGTTPKSKGHLDCGACGFGCCAGFIKASKGRGEDFVGPTCVMYSLDLGIALGSAVKIASGLNADNRILYTAGAAAMELGVLEAEIIMGIPISLSGKNPFFDLGYPYLPEKLKALLELYDFKPGTSEG